MEEMPASKNPNEFDPMRSSLRDAYRLVGAKTPLELHERSTTEDQKLMAQRAWDYNNQELLNNKIKVILEVADVSNLTDDEKEWRDEMLWLWNHHAIICAIWRYKDQRAAQEYSARALEYQAPGHPNKITRLFYLLTRDLLEDAEAWSKEITDEPEKGTAAYLLDNYRNGGFYEEQRP